MSQSSPRSERFTAIVSTLMAIAILAVGVTAQQSHQAPQNELARLESDLRFQLERAYKNDGGLLSKRMAQVDEVVQAWQAAPKSSFDRQLLVTWLTQATIHSMPGSSQPLPPAPEFGQLEPAPQQLPNVGPTATQALPVIKSVTTHVEQVEQSVTPVEVTAGLATPTHSIAPTQPAARPQATIQTAGLQTPAKADNPPIYINLVELTARIDGYHHSLDAVESILLTLDKPDLNVLAKQIQSLDEMTRDYHFVILYYESLTDEQRRTMKGPRSMTATLKEISRHLTRYEESQNEDFLSAFDTAQSDQLKTLRKQLAGIYKRVAQ